MTIIAWDGQMLAADKRACSGNVVSTVTKIRRIGEMLVGVSGSADIAGEMFEWIQNGRKPDQFPEIQRNNDEVTVLVIERGQILCYERSPFPILLEDHYFAIGSGRNYALAAMHCGKNAVEAVEVACHFDPDCGNGVDILAFDERWRVGAGERINGMGNSFSESKVV